jgi:hypothetical protein
MRMVRLPHLPRERSRGRAAAIGRAGGIFPTVPGFAALGEEKSWRRAAGPSHGLPPLPTRATAALLNRPAPSRSSAMSGNGPPLSLPEGGLCRADVPADRRGTSRLCSGEPLNRGWHHRSQPLHLQRNATELSFGGPAWLRTAPDRGNAKERI